MRGDTVATAANMYGNTYATCNVRVCFKVKTFEILQRISTTLKYDTYKTCTYNIYANLKLNAIKCLNYT